MNIRKKNNRKAISFVTLLMFILTQAFVLEIPVKAQVVTKASITLTKTADKTQAKVGDEINLNYTIQPNDISVSSSDTQDKEIVMVMDTSGSMAYDLQGNSRLNVAKAAAKRFIDKFSADSKTKIGLIQYSENANKKSNALVSNTSFSTLKTSIDSFSADGGTNTGDGLRLAYYILKQSTNANAKKYIVLFTDGEPTFYSYTGHDFYTGSGEGYGYYTNSSNDYTNGLAYADKIAAMIPANSNINSFMIGCTMSEYGKNTLKEISEKAKGTCSFAQTATDIDTVYDQLANKIQNELPINSIKFQETLPAGIQIEQVPAGFTVSGQTITGDLGSISYKYSSSTNKYTASSVNFQIKVKTTQVGTYSLSKDVNGASNSFITYKDIDNTDGKLLFQVNDVSVANITASIKLGKTVDKPNVTANQPFNITYTIQPDKIPVEDVDPSYQKGSDIVLVIDNSGSMDETLSSSGNKKKIEVVRNTANSFIDNFKGNKNINIALVKFSRRAEVINLRNSLVFDNLGNDTDGVCLHEKINSTDVFNTDGGTNIGDGLRIAYGLLKNQGNTDRKKYVILLTDGVPTVSTVKNNSNFSYSKGDTGYIYDDNVKLIDNFENITKYEYNMDQITSGVRYISNPGDNDYKQLALNYANNVSDIIKNDIDLNIKPIMIAFSSNSDPSMISQIAGHAGGEYKKALSETDMNSVYSSIATQVQSDFTISGVQFEETFPQGINLKNAVLPEGFTKLGQKVTGVLSSISYKLDPTGKYYEPLPVSGFSIQNLSGAAGANNTATQYILGSGQTSFISYKDINSAITKNPFPEATINIFPNAPADISASLVPKDGQADLYNLTVTSNTNSPNTIESFNVGGTEKAVDLWNDRSGLLSLNSSKSYDLKQSLLTGNTSLYVNAKDKDGNTVNETVPLISVSNVELKDIEQNNKVRPGNITFVTEANATITSLKINGQTIVTNQNTGDGLYKCLGVNLKDGDNIIEVALTNKFNNTSNMILHQTIDATPPSITGNYTYSNKKIDATFSENVNLVWLECDLNNDGVISENEKVTVCTDTVAQLKDIQVPDNFYGKNIVIKARDLSGNIGSGVPVDKTPPQVQPVYTDDTNKVIDVTVDELVNLILLECDVNKDGVISESEKVVILNTQGTEVRGVPIPDNFLGKDITVKARDLSGNIGSGVLDNTPPQVQAIYTDDTYRLIDVTVLEKVSKIWIECDVNGNGTITDGEKIEIAGDKIVDTATGVEAKGVILPDDFYGKNITIKATDLSGNTGSAGLGDKVVVVNAAYTDSTYKVIDVTVLEKVSKIWIECDVNSDGKITDDEKIEISTDKIVDIATGVEAKGVTLPDNFYGKKITVKATDLSGNTGSVELEDKAIVVNAAYTDSTYKAIDVTVQEKVSKIWVECDVNGNSTIEDDEKIEIPGAKIVATTTGAEAKGIALPDSFYGRQITVKAQDLADNVGSVDLKDLVPPNIILTSSNIVNTNEDPIITATITDASGIAIKKYASGIQDVDYFKLGGTVLNETTFVVSQNGVYTVYAKDNAGNETVKTINIETRTSVVVKKGIFINGKLLDVPINIVRSFDLNIGIGIKTVFYGQDVQLQINKGKDAVGITGNAFDLYEVTDETNFTIKKVTSGIIEKKVDNDKGQEFTIPMDTKIVPSGYKYYLIVFKLNIDRNAAVEQIKGNTIKNNSQTILDLEGKPFEFQFNIKDLPPLQ